MLEKSVQVAIFAFPGLGACMTESKTTKNSVYDQALKQEKTIAPRWLSGGKKNVPLEDNPTALVYFGFLERLSEIFIQRDDHEDSG